MTALVRYQAVLLARSQRWLPPLLVYAGCVIAGSVSGQTLQDGLGWAAAMLLPAVGWFTRAVMSAEPPAARAVLNAAGGAREAHGAALAVAVAGGLLFAAAGIGYELMVSHGTGGSASSGGALAGGVAASVACVLIATGLGALCAPPVARRRATGVLALGLTVVIALVVPVSPANAAVQAVIRSGAVSVIGLLASALIAAACWTASVLISATRGGT